MANFKGIVKLTEEQYNLLKTNGSVTTISGKVIEYDPVSTLYVTPDDKTVSDVSGVAYVDRDNAFVGNQTITGNLTINGTITQNGDSYITHAEEIHTEDDYIFLRSGAESGLTSGSYSGLEFTKYDGTNNGRLVVDSTGTARVGDVGSEQPIATRAESGTMYDNGIVYWNADLNRFESSNAYPTVTNVASKGDLARYLPLSGGSLDNSATIKLTQLNNRYLTISGNSIEADMSNVTGGWAGAFASVKDTKGDSTTMLGWCGGQSGLDHIFMGGAYDDPYMKMTKAGVFTFKNAINADISGIATKASQDANGNIITSTYLPLSGGTMTGDLSINTTSAPSIINLKNAAIKANTDSNLYLSGDSSLYLRANGIDSTSNSIKLSNKEFTPEVSKEISLGNSSYWYNNIYGTTIYENGKTLTNTYAPKSHSHTKSNITDFAHTHTESDITDLKKYLEKTTYEYNKEMAVGGTTDKILIGKFPAYDSNITIEITATTTNTYYGKLVIATQNIGRTNSPGLVKATVYGDATGTISSAIYIKRPEGYQDADNLIEIYFSPQQWSKNLFHIQCVSLTSVPTDFCTLVSALPEAATIQPDNNITTAISASESASATIANKYTDDAIAELVGTAHEDLNTIHELSAALKNDKDVIQAIQDSITDKYDKAGGGISGHIYLTGAKESSSTGNTSQLIFGTSEDNHVAITSNRNALVINPTSSSSTNQVVFYTSATLTSKLPGAINIGGKVTTPNIDVSASGTINLLGTTNATGAKLQWGTISDNAPYIGFASDQSDGTFIISSLKGTKYASGLAIGGGTGNLLWKGVKVATTNDIPTNTNQLTNGAGFITASSLNGYLPTGGGTLSGTVTMTGGDFLARYVGVKDAGHETGTYDKIAIISSTTNGYIRYRTKAELAADLGVPTNVGETIDVTDTTPSSATMYYPLYTTGRATGQTVRANQHLYYYDAGSWASFNLGAAGSKGILTIHTGASSDNYVDISPNTLTANRTLTIPDKTGTIAITSDIPTNHVTLDTDQQIESRKRFNEKIFVYGGMKATDAELWSPKIVGSIGSSANTVHTGNWQMTVDGYGSLNFSYSEGSELIGGAAGPDIYA